MLAVALNVDFLPCERPILDLRRRKRPRRARHQFELTHSEILDRRARRLDATFQRRRCASALRCLLRRDSDDFLRALNALVRLDSVE